MCHPERSEGSKSVDIIRFFALLRMTECHYDLQLRLSQGFKFRALNLGFPLSILSRFFYEEMKKTKGIIKGAHKPSSVPFESRSERVRRDDGHLSRILIAQHLKRPYPSRLSPA
jgi:hypothetical protein